MKRFVAALTVVVATIAVVFTFSPVRAETPSQGNPTLAVRVDADGSLVVSQRGSQAGAVITLPSVKVLPAEIDALVPRTEERKKLALSAESTGTYGNFLKVMNVARKAGFGKVSILGAEKETRDGISEMIVDLQRAKKWPPSDKALFVGYGDDGDVVLRLGLGDSAQEMVVSLGSAPDAAASLVPKGRTYKEMYFHADVAVSVGNVIDLLHKLRVIGFGNLNIAAEETEAD